jgi:hypothetical protein
MSRTLYEALQLKPFEAIINDFQYFIRAVILNEKFVALCPEKHGSFSKACCFRSPVPDPNPINSFLQEQMVARG